MLHIFYHSIVASAIFLTVICRGSSIQAGNPEQPGKDWTGAPTVGWAAKKVAQATPHIGKYLTPPTQHNGDTTKGLQSEAPPALPSPEVIPAHGTGLPRGLPSGPPRGRATHSRSSHPEWRCTMHIVI